MENNTHTEINTHKYDSKSWLHQGVKIGEIGSLVVGTMKATNFAKFGPLLCI